MWEQVESRLADLSRRAGLTGLPPAAIAAVGVVLGFAVIAALWRWWPRAETVASAPGVVSASASAPTAKAPAGAGGGSPVSGLTATESAAASGSKGVTAHVVGAVIHPGVYELPASSRVRDAVNAAGGLAGNAAQEAVNLARPLADGEQIAVPTQDDYAKAGAGARTSSGSGASGSVVGPGGASAQNPGASPAGTVVNINTADAAALDALPGVGPSTAAKIVADREANGPFAAPEDLGRVSGIGPKKLEQMLSYIRVR